MLSICARAQLNVTYTFANFVQQPAVVSIATLTPLQAFVGYTGATLVPIPIPRVTGTGGSCIFSNLTAGYSYLLDLKIGKSDFYFTNGFPVGLTGNVNASTYNGQNVGQIFAYFAPQSGGGSGTNAVGSGFGVNIINGTANVDTNVVATFALLSVTNYLPTNGVSVVIGKTLWYSTNMATGGASTNVFGFGLTTNGAVAIDPAVVVTNGSSATLQSLFVPSISMTNSDGNTMTIAPNPNGDELDIDHGDLNVIGGAVIGAYGMSVPAGYHFRGDLFGSVDNATNNQGSSLPANKAIVLSQQQVAVIVQNATNNLTSPSVVTNIANAAASNAVSAAPVTQLTNAPAPSGGTAVVFTNLATTGTTNLVGAYVVGGGSTNTGVPLASGTNTSIRTDSGGTNHVDVTAQLAVFTNSYTATAVAVATNNGVVLFALNIVLPMASFSNSASATFDCIQTNVANGVTNYVYQVNAIGVGGMPASLNLTNWSTLGTNILLTLQPATANGTNWSTVPTNSVAYTSSLGTGAYAAAVTTNGYLQGTLATNSFQPTNAALSLLASGNGGGLTSLSASSLASGTVIDARLSTNVPLKSASNLFYGPANEFSGNIQFDTGPTFQTDVSISHNLNVTSNLTAGTFTGNGSALTLLNGGQLTGSVLNTTNGNVGIGTTSPAGKLDVYGSYYQSGNSILNVTSSNFQSTFVGRLAGNPAAENYTAINDGYNPGTTAIGYNALSANTPSLTTDDGRYNTAVGWEAMQNNTTGNHNTALGRGALAANTTGNDNTALGEDALFSNTTADGNISIGMHNLLNNTGAGNISIGVSSLVDQTSGTWNTVIGDNAGKSNFGSVGTIQTDYQMTLLGALSGVDKSVNAGPFYNSTAIGFGAVVNNANQVVLGNTSVSQTLLNGNVGIGTTNPVAKLNVVGDIKLSGAIITVTNAAPSNVTLGVTAPDYWVKATNANTGAVMFTPYWVNH